MVAGAHRTSAVRGLARAAVVPAAAIAVHQLRYLLAFGSTAGVELQRQGHSYLHSIAPWIVAALAWAVGAFLSSLGRALKGQTSAPRYGLSLAALWLVCAASLVVIYSGQEFLEGLLATGHPAGLVGIFGYGGWWAIPSAVCVGLVLAALLHGARWVLREVAARRVRATALRKPSTSCRDAAPDLLAGSHAAAPGRPLPAAPDSAGARVVRTRPTGLTASGRNRRPSPTPQRPVDGRPCPLR